MGLKNILMTMTVLITIASHIACQFQFQFNKKFKIKNQDKKVFRRQNVTQNVKFITNDINNGISMNSNLYFGDILRNSLNRFIVYSNVNEKCTSDGKHFVTEFNNQTLWAVQMYDSSSKYPRGILTGEVSEFGNFDQCMAVSSKRLGIRGAYVLANIRFHAATENVSNPMDFIERERERATRDMLAAGPDNMRWAVCVPDSCTELDVRLSLERALGPAFRTRNITVDVAVPPLSYTSKSTKMEFTRGVLLACAIVVGNVILVVAGTLYALLTDPSELENSGLFKKCLYSYSMINNMKRLVENPKSDNYDVINGLKFFGLMMVIMAHRLFLDLAMPAFNVKFIDYFYESFWLGLFKVQVPIETFLIISGFLTYIKIEDHLKSGKPLHFWYMLAHRLTRILPGYIIVIMIVAFILPYLGDGPMWKMAIYPEAEFCQKNWWLNLLFINTYVDSYKMCLLHSWYLACDMHFFVVGILLTYVLWKWKRTGLGIFGVIFTLSIYVPAKSIYDNRHWAFFPIVRSNMNSIRYTENFHKVYIRSEFKSTTYLIGIAIAYVYVRVKTFKIKFSVNGRIIGCAVSCLTIYVSMAITGYFYLPDTTYNPWHHALLFTFQKIIFSLCITYFMIVGLLSDFGFISSILESKFFIVIARLSYVAYLIHFNLQMYSNGQIRQPQYYSIWILISKMISDIITTLMCTTLIYLIIEAPFRNILKHVISLFSKELNLDLNYKKKN